MYHYIEGTLQESPQGYAVLDAGGVGYLIFISARTAGELFPRALGEKVRLYTYLNVREDIMELYGFSTLAEKNAFLLLTSVSGVGAKGAMSILSALSVDKLSFAIQADDARSISSANGIGLKTAQKVILELKDKIAKDPLLASASAAGFSAAVSAAPTGALSEAVDALCVLGYPRAQVLKAAGTLQTDTLGVEEIIRALLQKFGGQ